jgi:hypothetical protein
MVQISNDVPGYGRHVPKHRLSEANTVKDFLVKLIKFVKDNHLEVDFPCTDLEMAELTESNNIVIRAAYD